MSLKRPKFPLKTSPKSPFRRSKAPNLFFKSPRPHRVLYPPSPIFSSLFSVSLSATGRAKVTKEQIVTNEKSETRPRLSVDSCTDTKELDERESPGRWTVDSEEREGDGGQRGKAAARPKAIRRQYRQLSIVGLLPVDDLSPPSSLPSRYRNRLRPYMGAGGFTVHRKRSLPESPCLPWPPPYRPQTQLHCPRPKLLVIEAHIPRPSSSVQ